MKEIYNVEELPHHVEICTNVTGKPKCYRLTAEIYSKKNAVNLQQPNPTG